MQTVTLFLLKSLLISGLMLAYYFLALRNRKLHTYNRFYLLATVAASLVIPFLHFDWYSIKEVTSKPAIKLLEVMNTGVDEQTTLQQMESAITIATIASVLYGVISMLLLALTTSKIAWIYRIKKTHRVDKQHGYNVIHTNVSKAPFSFMNDLFWKEDIDPESETGKRILQHELTHINQRHTLDKLFMQLALVSCWINPFYWLIQKELALVHEFLADEKAIKDNDTASFAMMLLESHYKSALPVIVNPFYSSTKRRIIMLNQTNKIRFTKLRRAMLLPLLLIPVFLFSFTIHKKEISRSKGNITLILDAAHGGEDIGATAKSGVTEKDLNLLICRKIAQLANEYNVAVVQTRTEDATMKLEQRVAKANELSNGVFVSIHVNKSYQGNTDRTGVRVLPNVAINGVEIFVSNKNARYGECKMLASAIAAGFAPAGATPKLSEKGIWVLKDNRHPAVAIECGNMDNAADMEQLRDEKKLEAMCRNILGGVVAYNNAQ